MVENTKGSTGPSIYRLIRKEAVSGKSGMADQGFAGTDIFKTDY